MLVGELGWRNSRVPYAPIIINVGFHFVAYNHSCQPSRILQDCDSPANWCTNCKRTVWKHVQMFQNSRHVVYVVHYTGYVWPAIWKWTIWDLSSIAWVGSPFCRVQGWARVTVDLKTTLCNRVHTFDFRKTSIEELKLQLISTCCNTNYVPCYNYRTELHKHNIIYNINVKAEM